MSDDTRKVTVGLIIVTEIEGAKWAALSRRGRHKIGLRDGKAILLPESFAGVTQPTVQGGMNEKEKACRLGVRDALIREMTEETNLDYVKILPRMLLIQKSDIPFRVNHSFAAFAAFKKVMGLRFEPCKSLQLVCLAEVGNIRTDPRRDGFYKPGIVMFPDDKEALILAFERFEELKALAERRLR